MKTGRPPIDASKLVVVLSDGCCALLLRPGVVAVIDAADLPLVGRSNLRVVTAVANNRNRTRAKGGALSSGEVNIRWARARRKWRVDVDGGYVGLFATIDAARAAKTEARRAAGYP